MISRSVGTLVGTPVGTPARGWGQVSSTSYIATCFAPVNGFSFDFVSFRAISFFSHPPTPVYSLISLQGMSLRHGSFLALGGLFWTICMSKKVLAAPVLDMPNHLSTYLLVHALFCVWPHCLRALMAYNAVLHIKYGYSGGKYHRHHIKLLPYKSINSVSRLP